MLSIFYKFHFFVVHVIEKAAKKDSVAAETFAFFEGEQLPRFKIGVGDEIAHFLEWVDLAGKKIQLPMAPVSDQDLTA